MSVDYPPTVLSYYRPLGVLDSTFDVFIRSSRIGPYPFLENAGLMCLAYDAQRWMQARFIWLECFLDPSRNKRIRHR